jgi:hypothetical protein
MTEGESLELCYIDPVPASPELLTTETTGLVHGGNAIAVVIVTCGAELGVDAVVDVGVAIVVIAC